MRFLDCETAKHTKLPQFIHTDGWVSFSWVIIGQASLIIHNKIKNWVKFREPDIWVCCVVVACDTVCGAQSSVQLYKPAIRTGGASKDIKIGGVQILTQSIKFPICDTHGLVLDLESKQTTRKTRTSETTLKIPAGFMKKPTTQKCVIKANGFLQIKIML